MKCNTKEAFKLFIKDMFPGLIKNSLLVLTIIGFGFFCSYIPIIGKFLSTHEYIAYIVIFGFLGVCSIFLFAALFVLLKTLYFEFKYYINDLCKRSILVSK